MTKTINTFIYCFTITIEKESNSNTVFLLVTLLCFSHFYSDNSNSLLTHNKFPFTFTEMYPDNSNSSSCYPTRILSH